MAGKLIQIIHSVKLSKKSRLKWRILLLFSSLVLIFFGVLLTNKSNQVEAESSELRARASEFRIESYLVGLSINSIAENQALIQLSDPSYLKLLGTNSSALLDGKSTLKHLYSNSKLNTTELLNDSNLFDKQADKFSSDAHEGQGFSLMLITFGSVIAGGLFGWFLALKF